MKLLGFEIARKKAAPPPVLSSPDRGWRRILEPYAGAWQANVTIEKQDVAANSAVFACTTLIASDIGKLRPRLLRKAGAIWEESDDRALSPLLRTPNHFQSWQAFQTDWIMSLMRAGNTYALIDRDARGLPEALTILNPEAVSVKVTPRGDVYYQLSADNMAGLTEPLLVPASEIIHHRINCMFHPLVGISPLMAAGLAAQTSHNIGEHAATFFGQMARPSGILTAPGAISEESATALKTAFGEFTGSGAGAVAVVGDGLKFESLSLNSTDSQLLEVLKWSGVQVAQAFRVPPFLIGAEPAPAIANASLLYEQYYKSCLQALIEGFESALDLGLQLNTDTAIELDVEGGLLRLDTAARFSSYEVAIRSGWLAPNEARAKENLPPVEGGNTPYLQQQNYSLAALAKRDSSAAPFGAAAPAAPAAKTFKPEHAVGEIVKWGNAVWRCVGPGRYRAVEEQ